ncbi:MAG: hypothetical protein R6X35_13980 [Candidatus Krumholzibacteriia bacterium]
MGEWWGGLDFGLQVFYGIGILASIVLVIQLVLTLFGADGGDPGFDADLDLGGDGGLGDVADHGSGLHILSTRTVIAFLAGFGWTGVIVLQAGKGMASAVLIAVGVGIILMLSVFWLMQGLYSLRQSGSLDYRNAVGQVGTVYVRVPPAGQGTGQIQVLVQGRLATVAAAGRGAEAIAGGEKVRVTGLAGANTLEVEGL